MSKISLTDLVNLQNETTAVNSINANSAAIETAFDNTLSRDGTSPNTMNASLDMNSFQIVNLPAPLSTSSPLRLADANTLNGGGTISSIPVGGTTNQVLTKTSNTDFIVGWVSPAVVQAGTNITVTGTPSTIATTANPTFATSVTTPLLINTGTLTLPTSTDTLVGRATTDTLTHKTFDTAGTGNSFSINGTAVTAKTGTGSVVLATSPTITNPAIVGTTTNDSAAAGNIGEYIESVVAIGSALSLVTATAKTITSISLTAGDWDVDAVVYIIPAATTSFTSYIGGISSTTNTLDTTPGKFYRYLTPAVVPTAAGQIACPVPPYRMSLTGTTSIFLIAQAAFTVSTATAYGIIRARRVR
jgi:hypothetical protein